MSLFRLLLLFSLNSLAQAAGPEVSRREPVALACVSACDAQQRQCPKGTPKVMCDDRHRVCVEHCDPQRLDRGSVLALYPPSSKTVSGPRHLLPLAEQKAICTQQCSLASSACRMSGNSNQGGGGAVMGGSNRTPDCVAAMQSCEKRCEASLRAPPRKPPRR